MVLILISTIFSFSCKSCLYISCWAHFFFFFVSYIKPGIVQVFLSVYVFIATFLMLFCQNKLHRSECRLQLFFIQGFKSLILQYSLFRSQFLLFLQTKIFTVYILHSLIVFHVRQRSCKDCTILSLSTAFESYLNRIWWYCML